VTVQNARPVALVSGRGIGRATVGRLARDGYDVSYCYQKDSDAARTIEDEVTALGVRALARQVDVTDPGLVREWITETESSLGPVEVVVTCAGIVRDGPLVMMKDDDWHDVIEVNLDGTFNVCRAAVFQMMKRRRGCVVNLSSAAGVWGNASQCNYAASKAGIIGFSKALSKEVGRYGIRVNVVAPGFVETDMVSALSEAHRQAAITKIALGRFGEAGEVADAISYLTTARYVTGTVLQVDGGITI
jgi:3-oxoacyl-[acyl-carrier protein] reductase